MGQAAGIRLKLLDGLGATSAVDTKPIPVLRKKALAVLAVLAVAPKFAVSRQGLATLFWGDLSDSQARHNLRQCLHVLRTAMPATGILLIDANTVAFNPALVDVDVV